MTEARAVMTELIVNGYSDPYTAFLARAALARLQEELGIATNDVAMVLRGVDGDVSVQQTLNHSTGRNGSSTFWEVLSDLLFAPKSSAGAATEAVSEKCSTVGIDPILRKRVANQFGLCESGLLVRTRGLTQREKVVGMLQGFNGELTRVPLES